MHYFINDILLFICISLHIYIDTYVYVFIQTKFRAVLTTICWISPFIPLILDSCISWDFFEFTLS